MVPIYTPLTNRMTQPMFNKTDTQLHVSAFYNYKKTQRKT